MKIRVIEKFYDKTAPSRLFEVGEVVDFSVARAADIVSRKLGEYAEAPKSAEEAPKPKKEKSPKPSKGKKAEPAPNPLPVENEDNKEPAE